MDFLIERGRDRMNWLQNHILAPVDLYKTQIIIKVSFILLNYVII